MKDAPPTGPYSLGSSPDPEHVAGASASRTGQRPTVTGIVCTRNEAGGIARVVEALRPHVDEVLVVDGQSTDDTVRLAEATGARVVQDNGRGKGDAYQVGIREATGGILVFIDADGSHEPADIAKLIAPIVEGRAELVIASRHRGGSDEWEGDLDTWMRAIGSGFLSVVINARWKSRLTDVLNGFRAAKTETARQVPLRAVDFDIEQHMIVQFLKYGHRVIEVGSHEYCRAWGSSKLPTFRKAHLFFWRLFLDLVSRK
jgi:dolichol-phosphate mannosyltransferase